MEKEKAAKMIRKISISIRGTELHQLVLDGNVQGTINELNRLVRAYNIEMCKRTRRHKRVVNFIVLDDYVIAENNMLLRIAAERGYLDLVKYFIKYGADPTARDNFAIKMAAKNGHYEMVEYLLPLPGVDPTAEMSYAMTMAKNNGHTKVVQLLEYYGIQENSAYSLNDLYKRDMRYKDYEQVALERKEEYILECYKHEIPVD